jgi:hypothetical protein
MSAGDFSFNAKYSSLEGEAKAAMAGASSGPGHHHYPYARPVRLSWYQDAAGEWAYQGVDAHLWEVFCEQCGDTDGPAENQEAAARQLRGPYRGKHQAKHAAGRHYRSFGP